ARRHTLRKDARAIEVTPSTHSTDLPVNEDWTPFCRRTSVLAFPKMGVVRPDHRGRTARSARSFCHRVEPDATASTAGGRNVASMGKEMAGGLGICCGSAEDGERSDRLGGVEQLRPLGARPRGSRWGMVVVKLAYARTESTGTSA